MNINSISNLSFNARMLKNVQVLGKDGSIIEKNINIEDTDTSKPDDIRPDIVYKDGSWENFAGYHNYIDVPGLAYSTLKQIKNKNAFIDMHKMETSHDIKNKGLGGKKAETTCFTFQIEGINKPYTVNYCFERELENPTPAMSYNA